MFVIELLAPAQRPDFVVTVRTAQKGWNVDTPGLFADDVWRFELDEDDHPSGVEFKFVLDGTAWMQGPNLRADAHPGAVYRFDDVQFPRLASVVENPSIAERFFPWVQPGDKVWDVLVVGSGIGGGILADELSDRGADVLVLEAGSYLLPTHAGNLPRRLTIGRFDKHVWELWYDFGVVNYRNAVDSEFRGAQGFNLGGRSVFWGGLTPRMTSWELDAWPAPVRHDLETTAYRLAETLMHVRDVPSSPYQNGILTLLRQSLPDHDHLPASMAVQYQGVTPAAIPTGIFSTVDLLLESRLTDAAAGRQNLAVNLNHRAVDVVVDADRVTGVVALDLIGNVPRTYRAGHVVLACGTIETARLALRAGLRDPNELIGRGFTDHPIFFMHFALPPGAQQHRTDASSKTLSRHRHASAEHHPYNLVLELGADFNQGRYIDNDLLAEHQRQKGGAMLCELVFMCNADLAADNRVALNGAGDDPPVVMMRRVPVPQVRRDTMADMARGIVATLDGIPLAGEDFALDEADLGGVAHEVGTMRMGAGATGVVNEDLRMLAYENLYVCDLSVFPTSPAANPTLTLAALAIRLADTIVRELGV